MPALQLHPWDAAHGRARDHRGAFSLVELVIVMLVLGIASAMALPLFTGNETTQLREAAKLLAADLDVARVESLSHSIDPRVVVFDATSNSYHVAAASDPDTPVENPFDHNPYVVTFGKGRAATLGLVRINTIDVETDDDTVAFGIYGQLKQPTDAIITLTAGSNSVTLTLDAATGEAAISALR